MWEDGARIYGTPGVHNNFPILYILSFDFIFTFSFSTHTQKKKKKKDL